MDRTGHRKLQLAGFAMMGACFAVIGLVPGMNTAVVPFLLAYGISYFFTEFGPNVTTFVISAELFRTEVLATAHGISAGAGKLGAFTGVFLSPCCGSRSACVARSCSPPGPPQAARCSRWSCPNRAGERSRRSPETTPRPDPGEGSHRAPYVTWRLPAAPAAGSAPARGVSRRGQCGSRARPGHESRTAGSGRIDQLILPEAIVTIATTRTPVMRDADQPVSRWRQRAACQAPGVDPELFFPVGDFGPALPQAAAAKRVCARCPVRASCLAWALRGGEQDGIWGGTTPGERRRLRARLRRPAARD
jgi:hypothetical protein